jgi:molecular chaperone GrpE
MNDGKKSNINIDEINKQIGELQAQLAEKNQALEEAQKQLVDCNNNWKRALADYQNLQKRIESEKMDFVRFAVKGFIEKLLGIVDDLQKAAAHVKDPGLDLGLKKLYGILEKEGVKKIEVLGKEFDIHIMEAISIKEGEKDNQVVSEVRSGYTMHGAVLRPAQVIVSKKKV